MPAFIRHSKGLSLIQVMTLIGVAALLAGLLLPSLLKKDQAPEVSFTTLQGERLSTASLRGKVVMVNFWATSCSSCVQEMPQMVETYDKYKDRGLEFVAVAMNYDPAEYVKNFAETRKLPFKVARDETGAAAQAFGDVRMTPTTFVIDRNGRILKRYLGPPDFSELHKLLEGALAT